MNLHGSYLGSPTYKTLSGQKNIKIPTRHFYEKIEIIFLYQYD